MFNKLIILILVSIVFTVEATYADGNIVAILVALRNQGICTDSCTIREYDSSPNPPDAPNPKLLRYYDISSSSIREYDSSPNPPDAPNPKLLRYYSISSSSIREYDSDSLDCKLLRYYSY